MYGPGMQSRGWVGVGFLALVGMGACGEESSSEGMLEAGGEGGEPIEMPSTKAGNGGSSRGGQPAHGGAAGGAGKAPGGGSGGTAPHGGAAGHAGTAGNGGTAGATAGTAGTHAEAGGGEGGGDATPELDCDQSFAGMGSLAEGGAGGQGDESDTGAAGSGSARELSLLVELGPWNVVQQTTGIAADAAGRVYVADSGHVYRVRGNRVSTFLTLEDVSPVVGQRGDGGFYDLDIGPDQRLYLALGSTVVRTDTPHQIELWRDLGQGWLPSYEKLGVIGGGCVGVTNGRGFWRVTRDRQDLVYDRDQVQWQQGCAAEDLATASSGVFLYQPGCNGSPLRRGNANGSGIQTLYETDGLEESPIDATNFICAARDPAGGFYALVHGDNFDRDPLLYHLTEVSDDVMGFEPIPTTPTIVAANAAHGTSLTFDFCSMATAPNGDVYIQTIAQLWRVARPR